MLRILFDAERLGDVTTRLHRALSYGSPAAAKAAWIDGFFADGALLIIHDAELAQPGRRLARRTCPRTTSSTCLPLVRRTFGTFSPPERRLIAERLDRHRAVNEPEDRYRPRVFDLDLAGRRWRLVDAILGLGMRNADD